MQGTGVAMKHPTPEQVMIWLKCNGWQCVREYDFSADFEKGNACVNVPTWTHMSGYPQKLWEAVNAIAISEGRIYKQMAREMVQNG